MSCGLFHPDGQGLRNSLCSQIPVCSCGTDGDYEIDPAAFTFTGGSGKVTLTCNQIHVTETGIIADIAFSSSKYFKAAGDEVYLPAEKTVKVKVVVK